MDIKNGLVRGFLKVLGGFWASRIDTLEITADSIKGAEIDAVKSNISNLQATATQLNSQLDKCVSVRDVPGAGEIKIDQMAVTSDSNGIALNYYKDGAWLGAIKSAK